MASFEVVVAGGGAAGMCCAAALAEQGHLVALVPEAESLEWSVREDIPAVRTMTDELFNHHEWSGGAWLSLARRLDLSVELSCDRSTELMIDNVDGVEHFLQPVLIGPGALADSYMPILARVGIDVSEVRSEYHGVLTELLSIELPELGAHFSVGFSDWLDHRGASPLVGLTLNAYVANLLFLPHDLCSEHLSVAAAVAALRGKCLGGGHRMSALPNAREGLFERFAGYIESKGGHVERSSFLAGVQLGEGPTHGVRLTSGEVLTAEMVAVAVPGARLGRYLDPLPDSVHTAVKYQSELTLMDSFIATRLGEPVAYTRAMSYLADTQAECIQVMHPMHLVAPGAVPPGEQLVVTQSYRSAHDDGATAELVAAQNAATERIFPGFAHATIETDAWQVPRHSLAALAHGPKIPRTIDGVAGLCFIGEGSDPAEGLLGAEAGAATGLAGAEDLMQLLAAARC
jgi:hypothetical protein